MQNNLKVIFENDDYLIVDKEAGVTVNRSDTTSGEVTLQDLIEKEFARGPATRFPPASARSRNTELRAVGSPSTPVTPRSVTDTFYERSGIVHRLDKETSGLLIVAKNPKAFENLQSQFRNRKVEKTYIALVHGQIVPPIGEIKVPVGRLPWNRKRFGVLSGGKEAVTRYEVLSIFSYRLSETGLSVVSSPVEFYSLVRLFPKTGRTHQIRVHLKYINHPIFADPLYAGRKTSRQDRTFLPRIFLHAEEISFEDPSTGERKTFKSELPEQLKKFLDSLEKVEKTL